MSESKTEIDETAAAKESAPAETAPSPDLLERIEKVINKIRPYIQQDGGDVQLVDYKDGVVTVRMLGACAGCMSIDSTLTDGIQAILIDEIPEVKEVKLDTTFTGYGGFGGGDYSWY
ncbi:NifU family protein [Erysipelotrichaceae bacterium Oil+RF-744-GAM-WT-6]|jgi:Fe-S cluster biogenesis protein NfuA|uniref:NifU family protein n=1 Tax=Stecheria intestinalis TaxID=2606630 RepID=A0A7X2NRI6_9FIRM|nr:NifU family protein [Lachnospiraceae bacterium]MSS57743.1 NifU family protein [Stecheria intestinalis]